MCGGKRREYMRRRQHYSAVAGRKRYIREGGETASNIPQPYTRVSIVLVTLTVDVQTSAHWWEFPTMILANKLMVHERRRGEVCVERVTRVVIVVIWLSQRLLMAAAGCCDILATEYGMEWSWMQ